MPAILGRLGIGEGSGVTGVGITGVGSGIGSGIIG